MKNLQAKVRFSNREKTTLALAQKRLTKKWKKIDSWEWDGYFETECTAVLPLQI